MERRLNHKAPGEGSVVEELTKSKSASRARLCRIDGVLQILDMLENFIGAIRCLGEAWRRSTTLFPRTTRWDGPLVR